MLKALLWKDYRQSRQMLVTVGAFLLIPYIVALVMLVKRSVTDDHLVYEVPSEGWRSFLVVAAGFAMFVWMAATGFVSGHLVASERSERSSEFLGGLPVPSPFAIVSKAGVGLAACILLFAVNVLVAVLAGGPSHTPAPPRGMVSALCAAAALNFGGAWLVGCFVRTPAIATASGIGMVLAVAAALAMVDYLVPGTAVMADSAPTLEHYFAPTCFVLAVVTFVTGCVVFLRRREP